MHLIYKHTCPNGKCYIGQTKLKVNNRWRNGDYKHCVAFYNSIQKYGWENITHEILEDNIETQEEADEKEIYYIKKFNSLIPNGYNIVTGGHNTISESVLKPVTYFDNMGNIIKQYKSVAEAADDMKVDSGSISHALASNGTSAGYFWCYTEDYTYENAKNIICNYTGRYIHTIYRFNLDGKLLGTYKSVKEASNKTGVKETIIRSCLRGDTKASCGYIWTLDNCIDIYKYKRDKKEANTVINLYVYNSKGEYTLCNTTGDLYRTLHDIKIKTLLSSINRIKRDNLDYAVCHGYILSTRIIDNKELYKMYNKSKCMKEYNIFIYNEYKEIKHNKYISDIINKSKLSDVSIRKFYNSDDEYAIISGIILSKKRLSKDDIDTIMYNDKAIDQYTIDGKFIQTFKSLADAAYKVTGDARKSSGICDAIVGNQNTAYGYRWCKHGSRLIIQEKERKERKCSVYDIWIYDKKHNKIKLSTSREIAEFYNIKLTAAASSMINKLKKLVTMQYKNNIISLRELNNTEIDNYWRI